jgi:FKBP-type peptidyl-prolyl cis-trans isomerase FkpA
MKRFGFLLLGSVMLAFSGCKKSDNAACPYSESATVAPAAEVTALQGYITSIGATPVQHSSGMFYTITTPGTGTVAPALCSTITVKYTGKLLSGFTFDSNAVGTQFQLGQLIVGWQKALPLLRKGGKITLYIPPSLGYGTREVRDNNGTLIIPSNSNLVFEVELVDVQ